MVAKLPKLPRLDAPFGAQFFGLVDLRFGVCLALLRFLGLLLVLQVICAKADAVQVHSEVA
jgi:hypothetical protein